MTSELDAEICEPDKLGPWRCKQNVNMHFVEFYVDEWPAELKTMEANQSIIHNLDRVKLLAAITKCFENPELPWICSTESLVPLASSTYLCVMVNQGLQCSCTVHLYIANQMITIDITAAQFDKSVIRKRFIQHATRIADLFESIFGATSLRPCERFCQLPRLSSVPKIFIGSREELRTHDFTEIVLDERSPYQSIRILKHPECGNVLVLNDEINMGESDTVPYTLNLMRADEIEYEGKQVHECVEVLILGGGDGGLIHQVRKRNVEMVTMIEELQIDEAVMKACSKHLRSVSGDSMDTYESHNHKIIVADCFPVLEKMIDDGEQFDVIIADLTDLPVTTDDDGQHGDVLCRGEGEVYLYWDNSLTEKVIHKTLPLLKPGAVLLTHVGGAGNRFLIDSYESMFKKFPMGLLPYPLARSCNRRTSQQHKPVE